MITLPEYPVELEFGPFILVTPEERQELLAHYDSMNADIFGLRLATRELQEKIDDLEDLVAGEEAIEEFGKQFMGSDSAGGMTMRTEGMVAWNGADDDISSMPITKEDWDTLIEEGPA